MLIHPSSGSEFRVRDRIAVNETRHAHRVEIVSSLAVYHVPWLAAPRAGRKGPPPCFRGWLRYTCPVQEAQLAAQDRTKAQRRQESRRVLARMKEVIPSILAQHPVDAAYAFGSAVRGTMTPLSDVDIALLLTSPVPPYERLKLELAIQGEIETASGLFPVDVRAINSAPLMVKGRIVQQGLLLYERDRAHRLAFEVATRKRYYDFAPAANRLRDAFLERVRREGLLYG